MKALNIRLPSQPVKLGARPGLVINPNQLRPNRGMMMPLAQVLPQKPGTPQLLPQGARLLTSVPMAAQPLQPGKGPLKGQKGKGMAPMAVTSGIPLVASFQQAVTTLAGGQATVPLMVTSPVFTTDAGPLFTATPTPISGALQAPQQIYPAPKPSCEAAPDGIATKVKGDPAPTHDLNTKSGASNEGGKTADKDESDNKNGKEEKADTNSDFDPAKVMEWKDGIGSLPGSDLKVEFSSCSTQIICNSQHLICSSSLYIMVSSV